MKKYLFGLFAIALAIGFSAFTTTSNQTQDPELMWFRHEAGPVNLPSSYVVDENQSTLGCDGVATETCRIKAPFNVIGEEEYEADFSGISVFDEPSGNGDDEISVRLKDE